MLPNLISNEIHTPIGPMLAVCAPGGLCLLEFHEREILDAQLARLKSIGGEIIPSGGPLLEQLQGELDEYFEGRRKAFGIPLFYGGTPFQRMVWEALERIPYGQTLTYRQLAEQAGRPNAARAVGAANGRNPIAILVPCHRLTGWGGRLTGYGGGLWRKHFLLALEKKHSALAG